jgi:hypothetical protein
MSASYAKPDGQKVTRHAPKVAWKELPNAKVSANIAIPALPKWRDWHPATRKWWRTLWRKPQAAMWPADGGSLHVLAALMDDLFAGRADAAKLSGEIRQHEDRHGLSPKALAQLHCRLPEDEAAPPVEQATAPDDRRRRLRLVKSDAVARS